MSVVTGFYREAGLLLRCPHCNMSTHVSCTDLFLANHRKSAVVCVACKKDFYVEISCLTRDAEQRNEAVDAGADESTKEVRTED